MVDTYPEEAGSVGTPPVLIEVEKSEPAEVQLTTVKVDDSDIPDGAMLCVDFGTSFSKAFASLENGGGRLELIDLPIGDGSTGSRLTTPSELLIDSGRIYFGRHARQRLDDTEAPADRLIDSIKQFITLNSDVSKLGSGGPDATQDPTQSFSRRDILVLYLGHLMLLTERALVMRELSVNVRRRFAHPAWKDGSKDKNESEMRVLMAEAVLLARSAGNQFAESIAVGDARQLLDQLKALGPEHLPSALIHEPVREATAAGAGALLATPEERRETYLIVDIGAGTTDVGAFICVNNPNWNRPRLFEITGAADAKNMAGNALDNALQKYVLSKSALVQDSEEFRATGLAVRRSRRIYKEQLFATGQVIVPLPTDENITVRLEDFLTYPPVVSFTQAIREMVARSAIVAAGDIGRINLVPTGGGASLPIVRELAESGADYQGRHVAFDLREAIAEGVRETNPDLVDPYPQIAVALGGSLPTLPEQRANVSQGLTDAPVRVMGTMYKS